MNLEYSKEDREITVTGITEYIQSNALFSNVFLYINDVLVEELLEDTYFYKVSKDGISKVTVKAYEGSELLDTQELGYILTVEYSKDKNRAYLVSILDNTNYYDVLSPVYVRNAKLIREIEFSFYSGNIKRVELLLKELKWN